VNVRKESLPMTDEDCLCLVWRPGGTLNLMERGRLHMLSLQADACDAALMSSYELAKYNCPGPIGLAASTRHLVLGLYFNRPFWEILV
jgi:hypothetical protein